MRPFRPGDLDRLIALTIDTFGPFYTESFRGIVGDAILAHEHGDWRGDYRRTVPGLHAPDQGKYVAVAEVGGAVAGYVAWNVDVARRHGEIYMLAVDTSYRRHHLGTVLCEHAFAGMKERGVEVVEIGTGGDAFHAPARALYESLGCVLFPVAAYYKRL
ncbi:GNAT family N-acetyltransferase [Actinomadura sp. 21ATH]|uniref:GNAT family N-acetyltransferase n=1 Tax=Actinomadura sp. 21ATH TaxID=1735444 RepID=UPI0035BF87D0